jgi:hypothetical protein
VELGCSIKILEELSMKSNDLMVVVLCLLAVVALGYILAKAFDEIEFSFDAGANRFGIRAKKDNKNELMAGATPLVLEGN